MDYLEDLQFAANRECSKSVLMEVSLIGIALSGLVLLIIIIFYILLPNNSFSDYTNWIIGFGGFMGFCILLFISCPVKAVYDSKKMNK